MTEGRGGPGQRCATRAAGLLDDLCHGQTLHGQPPQPMEEIALTGQLVACAEDAACAVIVTYRTRGLIHKCVDSVWNQVGSVVIVDNGSDSDTVRELKELESRERISVIYNRKNLGIAAALNQGVRFAIEHGYRWVLALDHDSESTPGMVARLLEVYRSAGEDTGIVAANPLDRYSHTLWLDPSQCPPGRPVAEIKAALSSGSLIDVRAFERIGFFNEQLFLYYVDCDFCMRLRKAGLRTLLRVDAILVHSEGHRNHRRFLGWRVIHDGYGPDARYYIARNTVFMLRNYYYDPAYCYQVIRRFMALVKGALVGEDLLRSVGCTVRGLLDGFMGKYGIRAGGECQPIS
jgi:rhamnosyltransferase